MVRLELLPGENGCDDFTWFLGPELVVCTLSAIDDVNGDDRRELYVDDVVDGLWSNEGGCGKIGELELGNELECKFRLGSCELGGVGLDRMDGISCEKSSSASNGFAGDRNFRSLDWIKSELLLNMFLVLACLRQVKIHLMELVH